MLKKFSHMVASNNILISIVIPCRNEALYIENCIKSLIVQEGIEKDKIEIIVVDGESTDGTKEILKKFSNSNVRVVNNSELITPVAMNLGVKEARGEYVAILGAHSEYPPDYLVNSLKLFKIDPKILGVGGPIFSEGSNNFSKATALCMSSRIGVGNAKHRFPEYEGYAEMACFPVFHKSAFENIGLYDEKLVRNQDDEFCFRLRKAGYKIYISPSVQAKYYVRSAPRKLFSQYLQYGYWRIWVLKKHKATISFRQLVPGAFFLMLFSLVILGLIMDNFIVAAVFPVLYFSVIIAYTIAGIVKIGLKPAMNIPVVLFILHFSYALGFYKGIIESIGNSKI